MQVCIILVELTKDKMVVWLWVVVDGVVVFIVDAVVVDVDVVSVVDIVVVVSVADVVDVVADVVDVVIVDVVDVVVHKGVNGAANINYIYPKLLNFSPLYN